MLGKGSALLHKLQLQGVCSHQIISFFLPSPPRRDGVSYLPSHTTFKGPIKDFLPFPPSRCDAGFFVYANQNMNTYPLAPE
jgi:hypothetical protein